MNAMTWWDHDTISIWSQPIGEALAGPLKGTKLELLSSQVTTWSNWKQAHPNTLAMINDVNRLSFRRQGFDPDFVIGVDVADQTKAYYYDDVEAAGVINDMIGEFPILIWAAESDFRVYLRQVNGDTLTFIWDGDNLVDEKSGTQWGAKSGLAIEGPLKGEALQPLPSLTSFDWAWEDFYPQGEIYRP
jgi:hypothetical protein